MHCKYDYSMQGSKTMVNTASKIRSLLKSVQHIYALRAQALFFIIQS